MTDVERVTWRTRIIESTENCYHQRWVAIPEQTFTALMEDVVSKFGIGCQLFFTACVRTLSTAKACQMLPKYNRFIGSERKPRHISTIGSNMFWIYLRPSRWTMNLLSIEMRNRGALQKLFWRPSRISVLLGIIAYGTSSILSENFSLFWHPVVFPSDLFKN